jgi:hypothetical protein
MQPKAWKALLRLIGCDKVDSTNDAAEPDTHHETIYIQEMDERDLERFIGQSANSRTGSLVSGRTSVGGRLFFLNYSGIETEYTALDSVAYLLEQHYLQFFSFYGAYRSF